MSFSTSPVVLRNTTALYWARLAAVKALESSVASTVKSLAAPRSRMAWIPVGIESCRNPAVLEKTSTLKAAAWAGMAGITVGGGGGERHRGHRQASQHGCLPAATRDAPERGGADVAAWMSFRRGARRLRR